MFARVRLASVDFRLPKHLSTLPIQTEHRLRALGAISGRKIDPAAHHGGGSMSSPRQWRFPQNVLVFAPTQRRILSVSRDAVSGRSSPRRPIHARIYGRRTGAGRSKKSHPARQASAKTGSKNTPGERSQRKLKCRNHALSLPQPYRPCPSCIGQTHFPCPRPIHFSTRHLWALLLRFTPCHLSPS